MGYKGQVLRGEKWFHLMTAEQLKKEPKDSSKLSDIAVYKESCEKVKAKKEESKPVEKK